MTIAAFLGSALPYAIVCAIAGVAWLYFNKFHPWHNRRKTRKREAKRWSINAK
jgi:hypothetical protein